MATKDDVEIIEPSCSSDSGRIARRSVFRQLETGSSSESDSASADAGMKAELPVESRAPLTGMSKKPGPRPARARKRDKKSQNLPQEAKAVMRSVLDPSLQVDIRALNPSSELRRILGRVAAGAARTGVLRSKRVIKRRHWLVEPDKTWPLVVRDVFRMEVCGDGSYRLAPDADYEAKLRTLSSIIVTHDIEALYQFVQFNPFHPHGLIQLATILIEQRGEFENAYQLIRRALFAIQSSFLPSFHPEKSLLLTLDSIFSSCLLRALLLYAHLLSGQGCVRTSLEVMKLIYHMEGGMATGCPRTHILLHLDSVALKADQFVWLSQFLVKNGLVDTFPSCSLSFAISQKLQGVDSPGVAVFSKKDILSPVSIHTSATTALLRTMLSFPGVVKAVLGREIPGVTRSTDNLVNKLVQAFVVKNLAWVKANDHIVRWMEGVVDMVVDLGMSTLKTTTSSSIWLSAGYSNVTTSEMEWGKASKGFVEPAPLLASEAHVLEVYSEEGSLPNPSAGPRLDYAVSLESNPIAAFFETLLPWSRVDVAGTESNPVTGGRLWEQLQQTLGLGGPLIEDAFSDGTQSDPTEEEEEIDMD